jgi:hypothetical protein
LVIVLGGEAGSSRRYALFCGGERHKPEKAGNKNNKTLLLLSLRIKKLHFLSHVSIWSQLPPPRAAERHDGRPFQVFPDAKANYESCAGGAVRTLFRKVALQLIA